MTQAWIVRAGRNDEYEQMAFAEGVVGIGWRRLGDLAGQHSRADIGRRVQREYPEVSRRTQDAYVVQLYAFRSVVQAGDLVVLLRGRTPDVAIGIITGQYAYRDDLPAVHVRPVKWLRRAVRRSEIGPDLLDPPALSVVYRISRRDALDRLREAAGEPAGWPQEATVAPEVTADTDAPTVEADGADPDITAAYKNLGRNLNYARNLTSAGSHLEELKVAAFEVADVYRAAWVQAVAALDHWVHMEIYERMARLCEKPDGDKPGGYRKFALPLGVLEDVQAGRVSLPAAVDEHLRERLAHETYQNPDKIRKGLSHVADVTNLWARVARVLSERGVTGSPYSASSVETKLQEIARRRNKIAHEWDEDPANPPEKNRIDAASTMETIDWIDQLAGAIVVAIKV